MENQMSMHVIYVGEEDEVMFRDVIFPKDESVDLTDNPKLFEKLSKLPYFEVVTEQMPGIPATEEEIAVSKRRVAEWAEWEDQPESLAKYDAFLRITGRKAVDAPATTAEEYEAYLAKTQSIVNPNEPVDPPVAPVEAPRRGRGRPRKVV